MALTPSWGNAYVLGESLLGGMGSHHDPGLVR